MPTIADILKPLRPCEDALEWAKNYTSKDDAWKECTRGDWMLWLLGTQSGLPESEARNLLVLCACDCAELALQYTKDTRVKACIGTARAWANGKATIAELREAREAAYSAAHAAAAYADAAAYSAAYAAYAAAAAAAAAADSADAAADAAAADAAYADRQSVLAKCADIVRKYYPKPPTI